MVDIVVLTIIRRSAMPSAPSVSMRSAISRRPRPAPPYSCGARMPRKPAAARASHSRSGNSLASARSRQCARPAGLAASSRTACTMSCSSGVSSNDIVSTSHAKDAVPGRRDVLTVNHGQHQPEHVPGVARVDDAVVPEPGGGVERARLLLVLGEDGCGHPALLLRREDLPPCPELLPLDGEQRGRRLLATHHPDSAVAPGEQEAA